MEGFLGLRVGRHGEEPAQHLETLELGRYDPEERILARPLGSGSPFWQGPAIAVFESPFPDLSTRVSFAGKHSEIPTSGSSTRSRRGPGETQSASGGFRGFGLRTLGIRHLDDSPELAKATASASGPSELKHQDRCFQYEVTVRFQLYDPNS